MLLRTSKEVSAHSSSLNIHYLIARAGRPFALEYFPMLPSSIMNKGSTAMPPRPWTSRGIPPPRNFSRSRTARPNIKLKPGSHKLRLVRRYMRRKLENMKSQTKNSELDAGAYSQERPKHPALKVSTSEPHNAIADKKGSTRRPVVAEVTAVPNPTPDTGLSYSLVSLNSLGAGSPVFDVLSDTAPIGFTLPIELTPTPMGSRTSISFSALPPLLSAISTPTSPPAGTRAVLPTRTQPTSNATAQSGNPRSHQVSIAVVILLSVGSALLLLGFCITVRMCSRPRRSRPVPSLPILKDAESEDNFFETKESPLFGGDERLSANPTGPLWTWVQYPHPKNVQPLAQNDPSSQDGHVYSGCTQYTCSQAAQNLPSGPSIASQLREPPSRQPQLHTVAPAMTFAGSRLSRASLGLYAPSAPSYPDSTRQETVFTADGHDVIKRSKSKPASKRQSKASFDDKRRESAASFIGLAYDGEDLTATAPVEYNHVLEESPIMNPGFQGRTRVKSGYFAAGTYPRMSTLPSASYSIATATRINVGQRNSFSRDKFSPHRLNSKRLRDAQALTCALGLASPNTEYNVSSPQPTLYPDDSVSIIEPKRLKKKNANDRKPVEISPDMPVVVPMDEAMDSNDAVMPLSLGTSEASLTGLPLSADHYGAAGPSSLLSRNLDKPPRVPSPPPLPSLTQMGLEHSNPEAYANYRSPTYSLYGLYETSDRKSIVR